MHILLLITHFSTTSSPFTIPEIRDGLQDWWNCIGLLALKSHYPGRYFHWPLPAGIAPKREEFKSSEANHFDPVTVFLAFLPRHDVVPLHRLLPLVLVVLVWSEHLHAIKCLTPNVFSKVLIFLNLFFFNQWDLIDSLLFLSSSAKTFHVTIFAYQEILLSYSIWCLHICFEYHSCCTGCPFRSCCGFPGPGYPQADLWLRTWSRGWQVKSC